MVKKIFSSFFMTTLVIISLLVSSFGFAFIAKSFFEEAPNIFNFVDTEDDVNGIPLLASPLSESLKDIENLEIGNWTEIDFTSSRHTEDIRNIMVANRASISAALCSKESNLSAQTILFKDYSLRNGDIFTFAVATYPVGAAPYVLKASVSTCLDSNLIFSSKDNAYIINSSAGISYFNVSGDSVVAAVGQSMTQESFNIWMKAVSNIFRSKGCINLYPVLGDEKRNMFYIGETSYIQRSTTVKVNIEPLPAGVPNPKDSASVLPLLAPDSNPAPVAEIIPPKTPSSHNYWPSMPVVVPHPKPPVILSTPNDSKNVSIPVTDTDGPGCGWAFSNYVPTVQPSAQDLEITGEANKKQGEAELKTVQKQYLDSVTNYYTTVDTYYEQVALYAEYKIQVDNVYAEWLTLRSLWFQYDTAKAEYDKAWADYYQWFKDRDAAQLKFNTDTDQYNKDVIYCNSLPVITPSPSPSPAPIIPSPSASPEPAPSGPVCPPVAPKRPRILDSRELLKPTLVEPLAPQETVATENSNS